MRHVEPSLRTGTSGILSQARRRGLKIIQLNYTGDNNADVPVTLISTVNSPYPRTGFRVRSGGSTLGVSLTEQRLGSRRGSCLRCTHPSRNKRGRDRRSRGDNGFKKSPKCWLVASDVAFGHQNNFTFALARCERLKA